MTPQRTGTLDSSCKYCVTSRANGRSNCWGCGRAIVVDRYASEEVQAEAELSHRKRERGLTLQESQALVDQKVLAAIVSTMRPLSDFTHEQISLKAQLNLCAVKFSLLRLAKRLVVVRAGYIELNRKRRREVWQYVPEVLSFLREGNLNDETTRRVDLEQRADMMYVRNDSPSDESDEYADLQEKEPAVCAK